jgi:hypothetical protein
MSPIRVRNLPNTVESDVKATAMRRQRGLDGTNSSMKFRRHCLLALLALFVETK